MKSALIRIWTRVAMSISYDDNHYTTAPPAMLYKNENSWKDTPHFLGEV